MYTGTYGTRKRWAVARTLRHSTRTNDYARVAWRSTTLKGPRENPDIQETQHLKTNKNNTYTKKHNTNSFSQNHLENQVVVVVVAVVAVVVVVVAVVEVVVVVGREGGTLGFYMMENMRKANEP